MLNSENAKFLNMRLTISVTVSKNRRRCIQHTMELEQKSQMAF